MSRQTKRGAVCRGVWSKGRFRTSPWSPLAVSYSKPAPKPSDFGTYGLGGTMYHRSDSNSRTVNRQESRTDIIFVDSDLTCFGRKIHVPFRTPAASKTKVLRDVFIHQCCHHKPRHLPWWSCARGNYPLLDFIHPVRKTLPLNHGVGLIALNGSVYHQFSTSWNLICATSAGRTFNKEKINWGLFVSSAWYSFKLSVLVQRTRAFQCQVTSTPAGNQKCAAVTRNCVFTKESERTT